MKPAEISDKFLALPKWAKYGVPAAVFAVFVWPTIYSHDLKMVGSRGMFSPTVIWNDEQADECLDKEGECHPIYVRTRKLRLVGDEQFDTWVFDEGDSRWFTGSMTYSGDGGYRAVAGMEVTDEAIIFAPGAHSRMMRIDGERTATPPRLLTQEWYVLGPDDELTELATGQPVQTDRDLPQLRLVLEVPSAFAATRMFDSGLYLADLDAGVIYWQFEASILEELNRQAEEDARRAWLEERRRAAGEETPQAADEPEEPPIPLELIAPITEDSALSKLKAGKLHLMNGQSGWVLPLDPAEAE